MSIITISRGTKSGGVELAKCLSEKLGYKCVGREEIITESSKTYNIMEDFLLEKLEKSPSLWQKFTNEYQRHIYFIQCALLQAVKEDNIVYHGYAGQFFLKNLKNVLKIRIEAPIEYRVKVVMEEFKYSHDQAVEYITKIDDERRRWVKLVFNEEWTNPLLYDICFNIKNMSIDNICDIVAKAVEHKDFKTTSTTKRRLQNMAIECNVKAALCTDDRIWASHKVSVTAVDGVVTLKGRVKNRELRDLIIDTTQKVKGVKGYNSQISLLSDTVLK